MIQNLEKSDQTDVDDIELSSRVITRFGVVFDAREDWWPINGRDGIGVRQLRTLVVPKLLAGLEMTLRDAARRYAVATLVAYSASLRNFQRTIFPDGRIERWHLDDLRNWRVILMKEFGHEDYLGNVRSFLLNWNKGGWPGVAKSVIDGLKEMRLKSSETGRAVRVSDPQKGPLTSEESHELLHCLYDAAERGQLDWDDFSLAYLVYVTGRRPIQISHLKCLDVVEQRHPPDRHYPEGKTLHLLAIPRGKQKGHGFRETRRAIDLNATIFEVFRTQRDNVQSKFRALLEKNGWDLQSQDLKHLETNLPLFPQWNAMEQRIAVAARLHTGGEHGRSLEVLRYDAESAAWHLSAQLVSTRVTSICNSVGALARDGNLLQVTPQRLRYSKGTSLARESVPTHVIAWLMDHSTSRSAQIYVDNMPEHAAKISEAMENSSTMQRIASMFRGVLVDSENAAVGGDDPAHSRLHFKGVATATCGHLKQCGLAGGIPRCCYTCSYFQPWLDGPHEELLDELLLERSHDIQELGPDSPVAKRHDKLVAAVEHVVNLCQLRRKDLEGDSPAEDE